jgi:hypothetical protein
MDTNLVTTNDALGELSDIAFEKIQSSLKAFELPEPVQQAICDLADAHAMLNMRITGGPGSVSNEDLGSNVSRIFESLDILDKACQERESITTS